MPQVRLVLGNDLYPPFEVPENCDLGTWKEMIETGSWGGDKVMYCRKLTCRNEMGQHLDNMSSVPEEMHVDGPRSIYAMLEIALKKKLGSPKCLREPVQRVREKECRRDGWPFLGDYHVGVQIGRGFDGPCVYEAKHVGSGEKVAVKWPAKAEEVAVLKSVAERLPPDCPGIPRLLASGRFKEIPYLVMDQYRQPLTEVYPRLWWMPLEKRWPAVRALGRMLVRRLEALHNCGFVHCDISPENILLSRRDNPLCMPVLIDFGLARRYPGGGPLLGEFGSNEWSSIRAALGGERRPEDDLEALGWVMLNAVFQHLPWCHFLEKAYAQWHLEATRNLTVQQVAWTKRRLLDEGWDVFGECCLSQTPNELYRFLHSSRHEVTPPQRPDYEYLIILLGGKARSDTTWQQADEEDRLEWENYYKP
mmetsp:Transcript_132394/g.295177  ORF Transcript_132394/g.295177 Transcript_132394/m.295177 type:complete len:420 (+) Transcript_132394:87-1346(+)